MFKRCDHCGELFFAEDVRRVENGRLCAICHERGVRVVGNIHENPELLEEEK